MSAAEALKAGRAAGIRFGIDGDALTLEAPAAPPLVVIELLSQYKADIVALLRSTGDVWSALDCLAFFDERARIAEVRGGLARPDAEARAFACCVVEWLNRNPAPSAPGSCAWRRKTESLDAVVLPFGTERGTHTWLHSNCWPAWRTARRASAIAALAAMGIDQPRTHQ
jgi:hypothetical protein